MLIIAFASDKDRFVAAAELRKAGVVGATLEALAALTLIDEDQAAVETALKKQGVDYRVVFVGVVQE